MPEKWVERMGGPYFRLSSILSSDFTCELPIRVGKTRFPNPVGIPAGWIDTPGKLETARKLGAGILTIKTITRYPKLGNPYPRIVRQDTSMINSLGLPNLGLKWWATNFEPPSYPKIISIKGDNLEDWCELIDKLSAKTDIFELNLSCPNVSDGIMDLNASCELVQNISSISSKPILVKLSPEYSGKQNLDLIDKVRGDIFGITAINTLPVRNEMLGNETKIGGLSGAKIYNTLKEHLGIIRKQYPTMDDLPIFATGGILYPNQAWEILYRYKSLPLGLTGLLVFGPKYYHNMLKWINMQLQYHDEILQNVLYS